MCQRRERDNIGVAKTSSERRWMLPNPKQSLIVLQPIEFGQRDYQVFGKESDLSSV